MVILVSQSSSLLEQDSGREGGREGRKEGRSELELDPALPVLCRERTSTSFLSSFPSLPRLPKANTPTFYLCHQSETPLSLNNSPFAPSSPLSLPRHQPILTSSSLSLSSSLPFFSSLSYSIRLSSTTTATATSAAAAPALRREHVWRTRRRSSPLGNQRRYHTDGNAVREIGSCGGS